MIASVLLLGLVAVAAQVDGASLSGVVRDASSGEPLAGVVVELTDIDRATASDLEGRYLFQNVPGGPQHVQVRRLGYEARTLHALVPPAGRLVIDISLHPEPVALQGLDVYSHVVVRGADSQAGIAPYPGAGVSAAAVRNHPLLAEPDFFLALSGGAVVVQPESPRGLHIRGGGADQVSYLLDGVPVFSPYHAAGMFSAWNADAISTLTIEPFTFGALTPDALSGVVSATTRRPGNEVRVQAALSNNQARLTVDGPLPFGHTGFLLSGRAGFPGVFDPEDEPSYLVGRSSDALAKIDGALAGGRFRLLGYENRNWTAATANVESDPEAGGEEDEESEDVSDGGRNRFEWGGRSWGGEWVKDVAGQNRLHLRGWSARGDAKVRWASENPGAATLAASRSDVGGGASYAFGDSASRTTLGLRASRSRTDYRVGPDSEEGGRSFDLTAETRVLAAFVEHRRALNEQLELETGLLVGLYLGRLRLAPRIDARWTAWPAVTFSAGLSRTHQVEQSLSNPESMVGNIFPPSLFVGAGAPGVPVARADQVYIAAETRPVAGIRIAAQAYARDFEGLVLVAPSTAHPFATDGVTHGRGTSRGAALDLSVSRARYALVASYGFARVLLSYGDSSYVPAYAPAQTFEAGLVAYPQPTTTVRVGISGVLDRHSTAVSGPFEWEPCNILDRGCEFAGSPQQRNEPLGSTRPPAYLRLDAGIRKHWHIRAGGRDAVVGVYATAANLLDRKNLLTVNLDPVTGEREWIAMSSLVPLVVGLDLRF